MNLNSQIKKFFQENDYDKLSKEIVITRKDGIAIYSNQDKVNPSLGALVGGLWQASESLTKIATNKTDFEKFRLGFDSSEDGLYILPVNLLSDTYFLCALYEDEFNPGKLKRNFRLIKENLELYMKTFKLTKTEDRSGYLFEALTDAEIDRMFAVSEA